MDQLIDSINSIKVTNLVAMFDVLVATAIVLVFYLMRSFIAKLVITIALAVVCYKVYLTLSEYKEKLDQIQNIQDKLSVSSDLLEEQLNKFNIFK